jgi:UDP-glucose 4-epimerase
MSKRNILITGGAGNVAGSLAVRLCQNPENRVVVVDNLSTGSADKLPDSSLQNFHFIKADVNNYHELSAIMLSQRFDYVFHYAATVGVKRTLDNPILVLKDIDGIKNVLELCKNTLVKRVFFSSSSEVYGEPVSLPQHEETTPLNSRLPYAIVKNVAEAFLKSYQKEYNLPYTILRFFNTYGPKQSQDFVLPRFINAALRNEPITIYGDGSQTRTFCYISDNLDVTEKMLNENIGINDTFNIGSDEEIPIIELAKMIIRITGSSSEIKHHPPLKEGDMSRRLPDIGKMKSILNRDLISIEDGIQNMLKNMK